MSDLQFIVAEVSKNWAGGPQTSPLLANRFEEVINTNLERGYRLHSFKLDRVFTGHELNETIIAVFEREGSRVRAIDEVRKNLEERKAREKLRGVKNP